MALVPLPQNLPRTLGELRRSRFSEERFGLRTVKDEIRENLICRLQRKEPLFPGVVGYEETVVPQVVNAVLSRHNFILLGLRGQAKTKLIRLLTTLLDEYLPFVEGSEIRDNPYQPLSKYGREQSRRAGRRHADRLPDARRTLRRKARDARRHDRRHDRRHRSDQGGAPRSQHLRSN